MKLNQLQACTRLYGLNIPIIGLTGGIGSGKSTVSRILKKENLPLIDADSLVKKVYKKTETIEFIRKLCPKTVEDGVISFSHLRKTFFKDSKSKEAIEQFIYSKLPQAFNEELAKLNNPEFVIYDAPVLFEKKLNSQVDLTVCVYCSRQQQIERAMTRDKCDQKIIESIIANQMPLEEKKRLATWTVDNSKDLKHLTTEVQKFIEDVIS